MFSKNYVIMVLFVGSLLSSDNNSAKGVRNDSHPIIKKIVIPALVGTAAVLISHKTFYLKGPDDNWELTGFFGESMLTKICANLKLGPACALGNDKISFENCQRMFTVLSGLHGLVAAAACRYGLNRFFPG